ncbi:Alpha-glucosidase 2 [Tolypocladium paradoxum]|uniref:Alpha-glucosidase 2 n=1 Tax=Tolypocladium paradoxum TaxID=94208 RepID=A0A2S4KN57_9HYPO|nr:Alpha-glucosidase 2 [Tolypocladium paradoxum]
MAGQHGRTPCGYVLVEKPHISALRLQSTAERNSEQFTSFECARDNIFHTTFSSPTHPVPSHPSAEEPTPMYATKAAPEYTGNTAVTFKTATTKACVEWQHTPTPIHRDIPDRSYVVDGPGKSHYFSYHPEALHVGLGDKASSLDLSGRRFVVVAGHAAAHDGRRLTCSASTFPWSYLSPLEAVSAPFQRHTAERRGPLDVRCTLDRVAAAPCIKHMAAWKNTSSLGKTLTRLSILGLHRRRRQCQSIAPSARVETGPGVHQPMRTRGYTHLGVSPWPWIHSARNPHGHIETFAWNKNRLPQIQRAPTGSTTPFVLLNNCAHRCLAETGAFFAEETSLGHSATFRRWDNLTGRSSEASLLDFTSAAATRS